MILNKPYTNKQYADLASYCNQNKMVIIDKGEYLESVLPPEPTVEEKQQAVRVVREQYFTDYVDWYQSKPLLWVEMTEEEKTDIVNYRKYLMDYTNQENWYEHNPLNFDEWKA